MSGAEESRPDDPPKRKEQSVSSSSGEKPFRLKSTKQYEAPKRETKTVALRVSETPQFRQRSISQGIRGSNRVSKSVIVDADGTFQEHMSSAPDKSQDDVLSADAKKVSEKRLSAHSAWQPTEQTEMAIDQTPEIQSEFLVSDAECSQRLSHGLLASAATDFHFPPHETVKGVEDDNALTRHDLKLVVESFKEDALDELDPDYLQDDEQDLLDDFDLLAAETLLEQTGST